MGAGVETRLAASGAARERRGTGGAVRMASGAGGPFSASPSASLGGHWGRLLRGPDWRRASGDGVARTRARGERGRTGEWGLPAPAPAVGASGHANLRRERRNRGAGRDRSSRSSGAEAAESGTLAARWRRCGARRRGLPHGGALAGATRGM